MRTVGFCHKIEQKGPFMGNLDPSKPAPGGEVGHWTSPLGQKESASPFSTLNSAHHSSSSTSSQHQSLPSAFSPFPGGLLPVGLSAERPGALGCSANAQHGCMRGAELPLPRNYSPVETELQSNKPGDVYAKVLAI